MYSEQQQPKHKHIHKHIKNEHSAGDENYCFNFRILEILIIEIFVYFGYLPFLNIIDRIVWQLEFVDHFKKTNIWFTMKVRHWVNYSLAIAFNKQLWHKSVTDMLLITNVILSNLWYDFHTFLRNVKELINVTSLKKYSLLLLLFKLNSSYINDKQTTKKMRLSITKSWRISC